MERLDLIRITNNYIVWNYYTNISNFGEEFGYIVINPTAKRTLYGRSWSYTGEDDELVLSVLKRVRKVFKVMEERVHITGFSQGASMTWRFVPQLMRWDRSMRILEIRFSDGTLINSPQTSI